MTAVGLILVCEVSCASMESTCLVSSRCQAKWAELSGCAVTLLLLVVHSGCSRDVSIACQNIAGKRTLLARNWMGSEKLDSWGESVWQTIWMQVICFVTYDQICTKNCHPTLCYFSLHPSVHNKHLLVGSTVCTVSFVSWGSTGAVWTSEYGETRKH